MTVKSITTIVPLSYNILTTPAHFCLFTSKEKRILVWKEYYYRNKIIHYLPSRQEAEPYLYTLCPHKKYLLNFNLKFSLDNFCCLRRLFLFPPNYFLLS